MSERRRWRENTRNGAAAAAAARRLHIHVPGSPLGPVIYATMIGTDRSIGEQRYLC